MKRNDLAPTAEQLYVYNQYEFKEIALELKCSERSVRTWAKRGGWQDKRKRYLCSKQATKAEFVEFVRSLLRDVSAELEAGTEPSRTKVQLLMRFGYMILPPEEFRFASPEEDREKEQQDPVAAVRQFLGL